MKSPLSTRIHSPASVCITCSIQYMTPVKRIYISTDPPHRFFVGPTPTIANNPTPFFASSESHPPPFALTKRIVLRKIPLPCLLPQLSLQDFYFTPPLAYPTLHFRQLPLSPRLDFVSLTCIQHTLPLFSNSLRQLSPLPMDFLCVYNPGSSLLY